MLLTDLLVAELRELYDGEHQLTKALERLAAAADSDGVRSAFASHLAETRAHVSRLAQIFVTLGVRPDATPCAGIAGIAADGERILERSGVVGALKDAALIANAQKIEHYEIASYGTAAAWAATLGLTEVAEALQQTLEEEKAADQALNDLAIQEVNISAHNEGAST